MAFPSCSQWWGGGEPRGSLVSLLLSVTEGTLQSLAELQEAVLQCPVSDPMALPAKGQSSCCSIVHVVNCEEEFQQQQLDVLWRILDPGAHTALQKHLVCGPVKVTNPSSPIGADQYFQLRKRQMHEASVIKYGELAQDKAWTEVIDTLTVAAIRFEMLSTAHRSQITLDLENSSISTKGTKSGAFVMYNCARLATLFNTFQQAVERGTYPPLPPASELNFSCLREEGEWLLLFNYLLPFPEVLQQAAQLPPPSKGIRITANTETVSTMCYSICGYQPEFTHGFQLLLQPGAHPGGELGVSACSFVALQSFWGCTAVGGKSCGEWCQQCDGPLSHPPGVHRHQRIQGQPQAAAFLPAGAVPSSL
uniref:DALR anticodon binding domain containing 3 n=1 Tax=Cyanistes caeruleus TaxID=156563 RepID=A0A8C0VK92_CYACU